MTKAIAVFSGGLDSTVLVYQLHATYGKDLDLISFNYGQKHKKELEYAKLTAQHLGLRHDIVDLSSLGGLINTSSLTSDKEVPDGHYAQENMKDTVVPNRNMIMLSIAAGIAVSRNARLLSTAVHAGDHFIYPDCRPGFIDAVDHAIKLGNVGFGNPALHLTAPFVSMTKAQIVERGAQFGVQFEDTWSCYKGGELHCGTCGTCQERREAFKLAGVEDTTDYEDDTTVFDGPVQTSFLTS